MMSKETPNLTELRKSKTEFSIGLLAVWRRAFASIVSLAADI
jgi:hypothetical protein